MGVPSIDSMGLYFAQQNAGKRILSLDLNWPEARELVTTLCAGADVICENFRPGTLGQFGLGYEDVAAVNPEVIYVSMSGYGQTGPWKNRPAFAPTVQAEVGLTQIVENHFGDALAGGTIRLPSPPWRFSDADYVPPSGPAWQGEHNAEILREAGVSQATIDELNEKRILISRYEDRWVQ